MNIHLLLRRAARKPTLILGYGSSIGPSARILNASRDSGRIAVGQHCRIEGELFVFAHGGQISIGDWCFVGAGTRIWSARRIVVGHRVLISHNVNVMDSLTHPLDAGARHAQFRAIMEAGHPESIDLDEQPVTIDDDAWIGTGAIILRGVTIGRGAIVGAGAVVTADVCAGAVVVGNPARAVASVPNAPSVS